MVKGERTGSTFSDSASSRVARAVSVLLESVCRDLILSFRFPSCLSLSRSCSCRFSIWHREEERTSVSQGVKTAVEVNTSSQNQSSVQLRCNIWTPSRDCTLLIVWNVLGLYNKTVFIRKTSFFNCQVSKKRFKTWRGSNFINDRHIRRKTKIQKAWEWMAECEKVWSNKKK